MQTNTDPLFDIVRSLTRSEKRYFKVICSKHVIHEKNNSILLFDYIDQLKEYDAKKINLFVSKHLKGESTSVIKHRLHEVILNALNQYHGNQNNFSKAMYLIQTIEILITKNLLQQAVKRFKALEHLIVREKLVEFQPLINKLGLQLNSEINTVAQKDLSMESLKEQVAVNIYILLEEMDQGKPILINQLQSLFNVYRQFSDLNSDSYRLIQSVYTYLCTHEKEYNLKYKLELELLYLFQINPDLKKQHFNFYLFFFQKSLLQFNRSPSVTKTLLLEELNWIEKLPIVVKKQNEIILFASTLIYPLHIVEESDFGTFEIHQKNNQYYHLGLLKIAFQQLNRNQLNNTKKTLVNSLQIPINCEQIKFIQEFLLLLIHQENSYSSYCKLKIKQLSRILLKESLPEPYRLLLSFLKTTFSTKNQLEPTTLIEQINHSWEEGEISLLQVLFSKEQILQLLHSIRENQEQHRAINYKLVG